MTMRIASAVYGLGSYDDVPIVFNDEFLADQYIEQLYRARYDLLTGPNSPLTTDEINALFRDGYDRWRSADKNGAAPTFYREPVEFWTSVPPNLSRTAMHYDT